MILYIDTTSKDALIKLVGEKEYTLNWSSQDLTLELLGNIEKLINQQNLAISDITEIAVNQGPGSYTGTRIGVAVANALDYTLNIPVYGFGNDEKISDIKDVIGNKAKKAKEFVKVKYTAPAKITLTRKAS